MMCDKRGKGERVFEMTCVRQREREREREGGQQSPARIKEGDWTEMGFMNQGSREEKNGNSQYKTEARSAVEGKDLIKCGRALKKRDIYESINADELPVVQWFCSVKTKYPNHTAHFEIDSDIFCAFHIQCYGGDDVLNSRS